MTEDQVIGEYKMLMAWQYEQRTGKPYKESEVLIDPGYEDYQKSLGLIEENGQWLKKNAE